jgi:hypothetical protein
LDQIDLRYTEDLLEPVLNLEKMENSYGTIEFHQQINVTLLASLFSGCGAEKS